MTANVKRTVEQWSQTFHETHIVYRLTLISSTCSSSLRFKLWITYANLPVPTALSRFKNAIFLCLYVCRNFFRRGNVDILRIIFMLLTMQCNWTFTKWFTIY